MKPLYKNIYIVVEGSSEQSFFTRLNAFCFNKEIPISFKVENAEGYKWPKLAAAIKKAGKKLNNDNEALFQHVLVFLDYDVFKRGEDLSIYNRKLGNNLYFFEFCFEDFLDSLLPEKQQQHWKEICTAQDHYNNPMKSSTAERFIKQVFPTYHKGICPFIEITDTHIKNMCTNQFHEDIQHAEVILKQLLQQETSEY